MKTNYPNVESPTYAEEETPSRVVFRFKRETEPQNIQLAIRTKTDKTLYVIAVLTALNLLSAFSWIIKYFVTGRF